MHPPRGGLAAILGPFFGDKGTAHGPLTADSDAGEKTEKSELPHFCANTAQKCEDRIPENRQHQRTHTPVLVRDGSPQKRAAPADEKKREEQTAVKADAGDIVAQSGPRQEFFQGGSHNEREDVRIHAVERPAGPRRKETAPLIASQWFREELCCHPGIPPNTTHFAEHL